MSNNIKDLKKYKALCKARAEAARQGQTILVNNLHKK